MLGYYIDLVLCSFKCNKVFIVLMVLVIVVGIGVSMIMLMVMQLLFGDLLFGKSMCLYYLQFDLEIGVDVCWDFVLMFDYILVYDFWCVGKVDCQIMIMDGVIKVQLGQLGQLLFMVLIVGVMLDFFLMFQVLFCYGGVWMFFDEVGVVCQVVIFDVFNQCFFGGVNSVGCEVVLNGVSVQVVGVFDYWWFCLCFYLLVGVCNFGGQIVYFYGLFQDVYLLLLIVLDINVGNFGWFICWGKFDLSDLWCVFCELVVLWVEFDMLVKVIVYCCFFDVYDVQQWQLGWLMYLVNIWLMLLCEWFVYQNVVLGDVKLQTWLVFVFLLVCLFNMVGLLLVKFLCCGGEIGVWCVLGVLCGVIFLQCLIELGVIGLFGGIGGLVLILLGLWLVCYQLVEYVDIVVFNVLMFLFIFVLVVVVVLFVGVFFVLCVSWVLLVL